MFNILFNIQIMIKSCSIIPTTYTIVSKKKIYVLTL